MVCSRQGGPRWADGDEITRLDPKKIIEKGLAFIPEERNRDGLIS